MLSEKTIQTIKSTVPVLEIHGVNITTRFYELLFQNHPELLNLFNHTNQKQGRQQTALANAVYAAAAHIDRLGDILPAVEQIAHKHRSLGIKPEHYPIVGQNLLAAIKDVLGDAATDDIMQAWKEAYGVIADAFIGVESHMYNEAETAEGGWEGFRPFVVDRKVKESDNITSFYLVPQDRKAIAAFKPGQYISLKVKVPGEKYTFIRQYSLSDASDKPYYRISVKREDAQEGKPAGKVSVYLHEQVEEGEVLTLSAPAGTFFLEENDKQPVVLISAGVGLTPMVSMLNTLSATQPERSVTFIHAARNGELQAMRGHVTELVHEKPQISAYFCYSEPTEQDKQLELYHKEGHIDLPWLQNIVPTFDAQFYMCGPASFMKAVMGLLKEAGVPASHIHFEFFGPMGDLS